MTKAEIEKKYAQLLQDVANKEFYTRIDLTNRVNCYTCTCGHITKTKDVDAGVTPMFFRCEKCLNPHAASTMYRDAAPWLLPTIEWYRPTLEQVLKMKDKPGMLDHVLSGGLDFRKIIKHDPGPKNPPRPPGDVQRG